MKAMNQKIKAPTNKIVGWLMQTTAMTITNGLNRNRAMSLKEVATSSGFDEEKSGKLFMKQIKAVAALLAMAASIGAASAQTDPASNGVIQCAPRLCGTPGTPFMIISVSSGQVIDLPGFSTTPGELIQQWPANGGTNQQWKFRATSHPSNGRYEIVSVSSGQVLDVPAFSTTPGEKIQQWPANGGTNQQWWFSRAPGSTGYEIVSVDQEPEPSGSINLVLDVPGFSTAAGTRIQQWTENNGTNQQWRLASFAPSGVSMGPAGSYDLAITGWGFSPGTLACPVLPVASLPCATVLPNGTFSATFVGSLDFGTVSNLGARPSK